MHRRLSPMLMAWYWRWHKFTSSQQRRNDRRWHHLATGKSWPRFPSGEMMPSPVVSPLLTTGEFMPPPVPGHQHRRQSSMHSSDLRTPASPRLSSLSQPQQRVQPPSIKDFEI